LFLFKKGLTDSRKTASGRTLKRELTSSEVIERQNARIKLLEGQVELLKKLEVTERRLLNTLNIAIRTNHKLINNKKVTLDKDAFIH
jgi:putative transposase